MTDPIIEEEIKRAAIIRQAQNYMEHLDQIDNMTRETTYLNKKVVAFDSQPTKLSSIFRSTLP
jgi:hypothetical protein